MQHGVEVHRYNFDKNSSASPSISLSDPPSSSRSRQQLPVDPLHLFAAVDVDGDVEMLFASNSPAGSNTNPSTSRPALIPPSNPFSPLPATINTQTGLGRLTFEDFFQLAHSTLLTSAPELLSPDFCLFTSCKKFMILASALPSSQRDPSVQISQQQDRYPSTPETRVHSLDDVTFWILDLETGAVLDKFTLYNDFVYLSHHAGVSLHHSTLAITSVHTQTIHLLHLSTSSSSDGLRTCKFVPLQEIGWFLQSDDALHLLLHEQSLKVGNEMEEVVIQGDGDSISRPPLLSLLKQRIMSFLYRRALASANPAASLAHFHLTFGIFTSLLLYRSQFIDSNTMLIKYTSAASLTSRTPDLGATHPSFFVVYCLETTSVLGVFENGSKEMLDLWLENTSLRPSAFPQSLSTNPTTGTTTTTTTTLHTRPAAISSPADNKYARAAVWKGIWAIKKAKNGGYAASVRRAVSHLPVNPQSFSESPYFDLDLFSFDEKVVNPMERYY